MLRRAGLGRRGGARGDTAEHEGVERLGPGVAERQAPTRPLRGRLHGVVQLQDQRLAHVEVGHDGGQALHVGGPHDAALGGGLRGARGAGLGPPLGQDLVEGLGDDDGVRAVEPDDGVAERAAARRVDAGLGVEGHAHDLAGGLVLPRRLVPLDRAEVELLREEPAEDVCGPRSGGLGDAVGAVAVAEEVTAVAVLDSSAEQRQQRGRLRSLDGDGGGANFADGGHGFGLGEAHFLCL